MREMRTEMRETNFKLRRQEKALRLVNSFLREACVLDAGAETPAAELWFCYRKWDATQQYEGRRISQKKFGGVLTKRFLKEKHGIYFYYGVKLALDR